VKENILTSIDRLDETKSAGGIEKLELALFHVGVPDGLVGASPS
jgi:hypothetical protein